jgi:hypothetical protein
MVLGVSVVFGVFDQVLGLPIASTTVHVRMHGLLMER